jgi:hypothetical protein
MFPLVPDARSAEGLCALYRMRWSGMEATPGPSAGTEWAWWMSGGRVETAKEERPTEGFAAFVDTGVFVFSEDEGRTRLVLRTAPAPECRVMPGHMHSDLMSIYLVESGTPLIVDSGTFTYRFGDRGADRGSMNWRAHLAGVLAHNTVVIAGRDPLGPLAGDFRSNVQVPRARTLGCRSSSRLAAAAACLECEPPYAGLARGVVHVRDEYFLVWSTLAAEVAVDAVRFLFQLPSGTLVRPARGILKLERAGVSTDMLYSPGLVPAAERQGLDDPVSGWVSATYGKIAAAPQVTLRAANGERLSAILFRRSDRPVVSSLACEIIVDGTGIIRVQGVGFFDLVMLNLGRSPGKPVPLDQGSFDGEVLWMRETTARVLALRSLATRLIRLPKHGIDLHAAVDVRDFDYSKQC